MIFSSKWVSSKEYSGLWKLLSVLKILLSLKLYLQDHQLSTTCILETEGDKIENDTKDEEKKSVKTLANILIRQQEKARKKYVYVFFYKTFMGHYMV